MIELLIAALAVAAAATATGAAMWSLKRRGGTVGPPALPAPRRIEKGELRPGDVVVHLGTDMLVEGVAKLREGGREILAIAKIVDGPDEAFLVIDPRRQPRCAVGHRRDHGSGGHAVPNLLLDDELELRLVTRASVRLFCQGNFGLPKETACEYGHYQGPGQRIAVMLLAEGQELLVKGRAVAEAGLELLPGDQVRREG